MPEPQSTAPPLCLYCGEDRPSGTPTEQPCAHCGRDATSVEWTFTLPDRAAEKEIKRRDSRLALQVLALVAGALVFLLWEGRAGWTFWILVTVVASLMTAMCLGILLSKTHATSVSWTGRAPGGWTARVEIDGGRVRTARASRHEVGVCVPLEPPPGELRALRAASVWQWSDDEVRAVLDAIPETGMKVDGEVVFARREALAACALFVGLAARGRVSLSVCRGENAWWSRSKRHPTQRTGGPFTAVMVSALATVDDADGEGPAERAVLALLAPPATTREPAHREAPATGQRTTGMNADYLVSDAYDEFASGPAGDRSPAAFFAQTAPAAPLRTPSSVHATLIAYAARAPELMHALCATWPPDVY